MAEYRRVGSVSTGFESASIQVTQQQQQQQQLHPSSRKQNFPSRSVPVHTNSVPSKDLNNKPPNTFLKKLTITGKKSSRPIQESRHKSEANNRKTTSFYKFNEPKPSAQPHSRPTIIRSHNKKKAPPPRPPPPKLNGVPTPSAARYPPSYDEVVKADLDAFIGEMNAPRNVPDIPSRPRPPITSSARGPKMHPLPPPASQNRPLSRPHSLPNKSEPTLIDFETSPKSSLTPFSPPVAKQENLLDLDKIFSCTDESMPITTSVALPSNMSQSFSATQNNYKVPAHEVIGTHSSPGSSKGEDWLQSCLRNTVNGNDVDYLARMSSTSPSSPTPVLPPRPANASGVMSSAFPFTEYRYSIQSTSPPTMSPPPVPPLPNMFQSAAAEFDAPPLPPRPKQFETTPHAIALYDYTAMQSDELSFKANELITLVHYVSDEWILGFTDRQEGIFPTSFVKVMVPLPINPKIMQTTMSPCCEALYDFVGENANELTFSAGDIIVLESKENNEWYKGTFNGQRGTFPTTYVQVLKDLPHGNSKPADKKCIALYDFTGEAGELSFHEGDLIIITGVVSADWMCGKLEHGREEGRFPKSFVQVYD